jgi:hypothetical protein
MATAQPDFEALKKGQSRLKLLRRPALRRRGVEGGVEGLVKSQALIKKETNRVGSPEKGVCALLWIIGDVPRPSASPDFLQN